MTRDDERPVEGAAGRGGRPARPASLQRVEGPVGPAEPAPAVRLCREWKGLTAADLLRDEVVERLPGRVLGALQHLRRGDLAAADRALPDVAPPLLAGPGSERRASGLVAFLVVVLCAVAALVAAMFR